MGAYNIVNPGSLVPGQPEDITQVLANLQAIQAVINGGIDNSNIATGANIDPSKLAGGVSGVPTGCVVEFAGTVAPSSFLLCDGAAYSRSIYATLFGVIGTTYGVGDGASTFNVPDVRGRVVVGVGTVAAVSAVGNSDSQVVGSRQIVHSHSTSHNLTLPNHAHAISDPGHLHAMPGTFFNSAAGFGGGDDFTTHNGGSTNTNAVGTGISVGGITSAPAISGGVVVGGGIGGDAPAYIVFNYIIKI